MAKKITGYIKLQLPSGEATPAPPVGPALGQHGVNIMEFVKQFNAKSVGAVEKGKKDNGLHQAATAFGRSYARAARWAGPRSARREHYGVRQAVQR